MEWPAKSVSRARLGTSRSLALFLYLAIGQQWQRTEGLTMTVLHVECVSQWVEYDHDLVSGNFVVVEKNSDWYNDVEDVEMVPKLGTINSEVNRYLIITSDRRRFVSGGVINQELGGWLFKQKYSTALHTEVGVCSLLLKAGLKMESVTGPTGATVMSARSRGGQKFSFRSTRRGHYKFCFHNPTSSPEQISFSIHVGHIPESTEVAKDEHFYGVEVKIAQLKEALESVSLEQAYLKRRDIRHKKTNESTQRRLLWYTIMEYVALVAISLAQVYLIQRLFSKRIGYNKF